MEYSTELAEIEIVYKKKVKAQSLPKITRSIESYNLFKEIWSDKIELVEEAYVLFLNRGNKCLGWLKLSVGGIDGTVVEKHATLGEHVTEATELFVITDLSEIWADFQAYGSDAEEIAEGQEVLIDLPNVKEPVSGKVVYISPIADEATQSKLIRAILSNATGALRPGIFVSGILRTKGENVALVVTRDAVQSFRDWKVVFLTDGKVFQAIPVELGKQDSKYVEVLSGISAGARYVSKNSYLIKADIEKSGASHDH